MCAIAVIQILATLWATAVIERKGRRNLIIEGQIQVIVVLVMIYFVDTVLRLVLSPHLVNYLIIFLIMIHIIVHNKGLGPICIVYCADIMENLNWMIIAIKICSFTVAMTSEYMI